MSTSKIFICNLSYGVMAEDLKALFGEYGRVLSARIVLDHSTGNSRGIAFVEMSTIPEASAAMRGLNGYQLQGRPIRLAEAKPQAARGTS